MRGNWKVSVIASILILTTLGISQIVFADNPIFGAAVNVSNDSTDSLQGDLAVSGQNVYVVWTDRAPTGTSPAFLSNVFFSKSTNNGASFQPSINISNLVLGSNPVSIQSQVAAAGSRVYVLWQENFFGTSSFPSSSIKIRVSNDNGQTFSSYTLNETKNFNFYFRII